jgi:hypothetical protein
MEKWTSELLSSSAGILLSLIFTYVPWVSDWYEELEAKYKQLVMLAALLAVSGAVYGFSCLEWLKLNITCDQVGAVELLKVFIAALIANQGVYLLTRKDAGQSVKSMG